MNYKFQYSEDESLRADLFLVKVIENITRSSLKNRLLSLKVNNKNVKPSCVLNSGDIIEVELAKPASEIDFLKANKIELDIVYEDEDTIIINKEQGLVVHPAVGHPDNTLVNALNYKAEQDGNINLPERAGIVHRLDKDTSGLILVAKNNAALEYYLEQFANREVKKVYYAIVKGKVFPHKDTIETYQTRDPKNRKKFADSKTEQGKLAITDYEVIENFRNYSLVKLMPLTGRTHQLRVHLSGRGWPILGDPVYARKDNNFSHAKLALHAGELEFRLFSNKEIMKFTAELPKSFELLLEQLKKAYN